MSIKRWRLILGRFANKQLPNKMSNIDTRRDDALDYLYSREYRGRGVRPQQIEKTGSLDPSQISIPEWLSEVRELFPKETVEVIERHALDRYQLTELLTDAEVLNRLEPNVELLKLLLAFRSQLQNDEVIAAARRIIRQVVEEIRRRLEGEVRRQLFGSRSRSGHSRLRVARNLDWRSTIRRNLKHYDPDKSRLYVQELKFYCRVERRLPWEILLCVDQSGSMAGSVIHSAVMAGILAGLPSIRVRLVVFNTDVVDLSEHVGDPVEMLMNVQLGGGTNIAAALAYCESLISNPHRSILVLVSDLCEGGSTEDLLAICKRLAESGVRTLGLASLNSNAEPYYDRDMAELLAECGMQIAALTPGRLAQWLAQVIS